MKRMGISSGAILLVALLGAGTVAANPVLPVMWFFRDTPVDNPNGIWDDQWSGGSVYPPGEIITEAWPPEYPCGDSESAVSITRVGSGENMLLAYSDPPFEDDETVWRSDVLLSLRQACPEVATVDVTLFLVDTDGSNPVFLASAAQVVSVAPWPPTTVYFELDSIPQLPIDNQRFLLIISTNDGQCTDLVWECWNEEWPSYISIPAKSLPTERISWGAFKAQY